MIKRIMTTILSLSIVLSCSFSIYSYNDDILIIDEKDTQIISIQFLDKFLLEYDDTEYGGAYIGEDGQLIINLLESDNAEQQEYISKNNREISRLRKNMKGSEVQTKFVRFSMKYLKNIIDEITPDLSKFGFLGVGIDEESNCVVIDAGLEAKRIAASNIASEMGDATSKINTEMDLNAVVDAIIKSKDMDRSAIQIKEHDLTVENTATVKPGSQVKKGTSSFTVAWGATVEYAGTNKGKNVFLVPGHAVSKNDKVTTKGLLGITITLGTVIEKAFGGNYDFAYVERNGNSVSNKLPNGDVLPQSGGPNIPQNYSVSAYGYVSGKQTGKVLLTNYSSVIAGTTITGMYKTSYKAIGGDSGAPVWGVIAVGMQSASALSNGNWVNGSYSICTNIYELERRNSKYDIFIKTF